VLIIVAAADAARANAAVAPISGGRETFGAPLTPRSRERGVGSPTHYACEWQMTEAQRLEVLSALEGITVTWVDRDHWDPHSARPTAAEVVTEEGLDRR